MHIDRQQIGKRMSQIVVHGDTVYLAGQVSTDRSSDVRNQTEEVLSKIDELLAEAGSDKTRILSAQIWLRDIDRDFTPMNDIWEKWMPAGCAPARATTEAKMAAPDILVEVMVIAAR